ncbi:MAG: BPL-N domain-containing protein [Nitrospirota bacterium]
MRTSSRSDLPERHGRTALLWDESFLWGVMARKALHARGLAFEMIRAKDVRDGRLHDYSLLFVPGGWASNKIKALGNDGIEEIKRFVREGGSYLGFCGGAGLATMDGIGLVGVRRRPTRERVPSFSGRIGLNITGHPLWEGLRNSELQTEPAPERINGGNSLLVFQAWWPSQLVVEDGIATVLASYGEAMPDSFSSDVNVGDAEALKKWPDLERIYQINLDPKRLRGEPAVIEGSFGKGRVVLSLVHFDTPGDANGQAVLENIWKYLGGKIAVKDAGYTICDEEKLELRALHRNASRPESIVSEMECMVKAIVELGCRNFLWFWRNSMLLQWRRGVRGLEYCTLFIMMKELAEALRAGAASCTLSDLERIRGLLLPFADKAKRLLLMERYAMQNGHITYEKCDDPGIQLIREELFSRSKSYGGLFKRLLDEIDGSLFRVLTETRTRKGVS